MKEVEMRSNIGMSCATSSSSSFYSFHAVYREHFFGSDDMFSDPTKMVGDWACLSESSS
jgi:hypothetical protein